MMVHIINSAVAWNSTDSPVDIVVIIIYMKQVDFKI